METKTKRNFGDIWNAIYIPLLGLATLFALTAIGYRTLQGQSIALDVNPLTAVGISLAILGSALTVAITVASARKRRSAE